ncbi:MAG: hypothetical protein ACK4RK_11665 [Gemmataceae bacterium]
MRNTSRLLGLLIGLLFVGQPALAQAPLAPLPKPEPSKFLRLLRNDQKEPIALQTTITRYVPAKGEGGVVVDLIGVVHIGDRDYYEKLNKHFEQYDVLLYELVAPKGMEVPKRGQKSDNPLALLQQLAKSVLDLEGQMDHIDYTKKNFVHADLSPEEMAKIMRERGDDEVTLMLSITADLLRQYNLQRREMPDKPAPVVDLEDDFLTLLLDPRGPAKLKIMLAQQFETLDSPDGGLGQTINTILISDRNQAAMKVFQKELAQGKKKIGIFYGAAHMPDFEKRLRADWGLKKDSEQWLTAWDLRRNRSALEGVLRILDQLP